MHGGGKALADSLGWSVERNTSTLNSSPAGWSGRGSGSGLRVEGGGVMVLRMDDEPQEDIHVKGLELNLTGASLDSTGIVELNVQDSTCDEEWTTALAGEAKSGRPLPTFLDLPSVDSPPPKDCNETFRDSTELDQTKVLSKVEQQYCPGLVNGGLEASCSTVSAIDLLDSADDTGEPNRPITWNITSQRGSTGTKQTNRLKSRLSERIARVPNPPLYHSYIAPIGHASNFPSRLVVCTFPSSSDTFTTASPNQNLVPLQTYPSRPRPSARKPRKPWTRSTGELSGWEEGLEYDAQAAASSWQGWDDDSTSSVKFASEAGDFEQDFGIQHWDTPHQQEEQDEDAEWQDPWDLLAGIADQNAKALERDDSERQDDLANDYESDIKADTNDGTSWS